MKTDCFAYRTATRCGILTEVLCSKGDCSFYKTQKQYKADLEKYPPINYKGIYEKRHKNERGVNDEQ